MANIPNSKKPAIFLKDNAKAPEILAVAALYKYYVDNGSKPEVIANKSNAAAAKVKALVEGAVIKDSLPPKKFVISVKKTGADVQNVQWQQDRENLNIYISAVDGLMNGNGLRFNVTGADYDLALLPGVKSLEELGALAQQKNFFMDVKLFSIGSDLNLNEKYNHSSSNLPNLTTLSEQVLASMDQSQIKAMTAQILFSGILLETKQLTSEIKSSEIFTNLRKLADKGAKTTSVKQITAKVGAENTGNTDNTDNSPKPQGEQPDGKASGHGLSASQSGQPKPAQQQ